MISLALRTDNPQAELYLFDASNEQLDKIVWEAHRELSATIHIKIAKLLSENNLKLSNLSGIIFFKGPGSFTGLRIGVSVANALGSSLGIPVVATNGEDWQTVGRALLVTAQAHDFSPVEPFYGGDAHITMPKK